MKHTVRGRSANGWILFATTERARHPDNLQAAFPDVKLRYPPRRLEKTKALAQRYRTALSDISDLLLPHYDDPRRDHIYQSYTLRAKQGNAFSDYLKANGVEVLTQFRKPYYRHEALRLEDRGFRGGRVTHNGVSSRNGKNRTLSPVGDYRSSLVCHSRST